MHNIRSQPGSGCQEGFSSRPLHPLHCCVSCTQHCWDASLAATLRPQSDTWLIARHAGALSPTRTHPPHPTTAPTHYTHPLHPPNALRLLCDSWQQRHHRPAQSPTWWAACLKSPLVSCRDGCTPCLLRPFAAASGPHSRCRRLPPPMHAPWLACISVSSWAALHPGQQQKD
jgi:hypothetical protein